MARMGEESGVYRFWVGKPEGRIPMGRPSGRWAVHVARMGEESGVYKFSVRKPEGRRTMGRPSGRWAVHVSRMGEETVCIVSWWGNRTEGDYCGNLDVVGLGI